MTTQLHTTEDIVAPHPINTPSDSDRPGAALLLAAGLDGWTVSAEGVDETMTFNDYEPALQRACELARSKGSALYVRGNDGKLIGKWEFYSEMPMPDAVHVIPSADGWAIRREATPLAGLFDTKAEAVAEARRVAATCDRDLVVHYASGEVQRVQTA